MLAPAIATLNVDKKYIVVMRIEDIRTNNGTICKLLAKSYRLYQGRDYWNAAILAF